MQRIVATSSPSSRKTHVRSIQCWKMRPSTANRTQSENDDHDPCSATLPFSMQSASRKLGLLLEWRHVPTKVSTSQWTPTYSSVSIHELPRPSYWPVCCSCDAAIVCYGNGDLFTFSRTKSQPFVALGSQQTQTRCPACSNPGVFQLVDSSTH
jgi:hypothetical protein